MELRVQLDNGDPPTVLDHARFSRKVDDGKVYTVTAYVGECDRCGWVTELRSNEYAVYQALINHREKSTVCGTEESF